METLISSLKNTWNNLSLPTRIAGGVIVLAAFISLILIAVLSGPDYQPLYTGLSLSDAAEITSTLAENGIDYSLSDNGSTILVPSDLVYQTRITLAAKGLPSGEVVGFETFNTTRLGETEADRQLRYRVALEGELTRTIRSLDEIEDARVHLVIPPSSLFVRDTQPSTASVLLRLKPGTSLSQQQIRGIAHLLATSVERLAPENITIVDTRGNVLNDFSSANGINSSAVSQRLEMKSAYEQQLAANIRAMLERVYGYGKVVALVSVDFDFDVIEQYQEIYSAPTRDGGLIRSEQRFNEYYFDDLLASGVPGVETNIPGYVQVDPEQGGVMRQESIINYELNRTEIHQSTPAGSIRNMSVSIWIDGELSQADIDAIEASVAGALGMKTDRGDYVSVAAVPFQSDFSFVSSEEVIALSSESSWLYLVIIGVLVAFLVIVILRQIRIQKSQSQLEQGIEIAAAVDEPDEELSLEEKEKVDVMRRLRQYSNERPKEFAQMIRSWLLDD